MIRLEQKIPRCDICGVVLPPISNNHITRVRCTRKENPDCYRLYQFLFKREIFKVKTITKKKLRKEPPRLSQNVSFREYAEHICFNCDNWKKITRIDRDVWVWCPATNRETKDVDRCEDNWIPFIGDGKNKKEEELLEEKGVLE